MRRSDNNLQVGKKTCKTCGYDLAIGEFYSNRKTCKECYKNKQKERKNKSAKAAAVGVETELIATLGQINHQEGIKTNQKAKQDERLHSKTRYRSNDMQINKAQVGKQLDKITKKKENDRLEKNNTKKHISEGKEIVYTCQNKKITCTSCQCELDVDQFYLNRKMCLKCHKNMQKKKEYKNKSEAVAAVEYEVTPVENDLKYTIPTEKDKNPKLNGNITYKNINVQLSQAETDETFLNTHTKIKEQGMKHLENTITKQHKSENDRIVNDFIKYLQVHKPHTGLGRWFHDLWLPLLQNSVVIISPAILSWLGFSGDQTNTLMESADIIESSSYQQSEECNKDEMNEFLESLENNSIEYIELKQADQLALSSAYIQSEINYLQTKAPTEEISSKIWIALKIDCFKYAVMKLDFSSEVRCSFANLENQVIDYVREELQQTLKSEKKKNIRLVEFLMNTKPIENNDWLYIATTTNYAPQQIFKVGSTKRLARRINGYQTGRLPGDEYYYVKVYKCSNGTEVDRMVRFHLKPFKASKLPSATKQSTDNNRAAGEDLTELYVINYQHLVKIVTSIVKGFNETVENVNEYIGEFPNLFEKEVEIPEPLAKSIWMKC